MQSIEEIEKSYSVPDPWGYKTNPEDLKRKNKIINAVKMLDLKLERSVLDIGCGEGWITADLPVDYKHGYEVSKNARSRWPHGIIDFWPEFTYDIVIATGILYYHYDYKLFIKMINDYSYSRIITCNIKDWEVKEIDQIKATQIHEEEFPYREYIQKLRVFRK